MFNLHKIYKKFVFNRQLLKLSRFFHFEKIVPKEIFLEPNEKCLLLSPHFDDETLGCGGVLIKYPQNFHIVCLTDGSKGSQVDNEELPKTRKQEFVSVMNELSITSYEFLDIEDGKVIYNYDKFKTIEISDYDYIFLPGYFENHKDHKAVTPLLQKLLKEKKAKKNLKICFYEIWSALALPNAFVDITRMFKRKTELINIYQSQLKFCDLKQILSLNAYRGILVSLGQVEMFSLVDTKTFLKL